MWLPDSLNFMKRHFFALAALAASVPAFGQQFIVSTVAGNPTVQGYFGDGQLATIGQLSRPLKIAVDGKGNIFIADFYNYAIRQVSATDGKISTLAGNGIAGSKGDGGAGTSAEISDVHGLAVDGSGNVYIADTSNNSIRKIDSKGVITTFAGNGSRGNSGDSGAAVKASLYFPAGLAVDASGNVYVADYGSYTVRKITSDGKIATIAGTGAWGASGDGGPAARALLASPIALALDKAGNLYIGDTGNSNIRKVDTAGNISTVVSGVNPQSIAVDGTGNVYYVDGISSTVRQVLANGYAITIAGTSQPGYNGDGIAGRSAQLNQPNGLAVDAAGNVFVADTSNHAIRKLTPQAFSVGGVANSASGLAGPVAPGEIVTLYGTGIGPATLTLLTTLSGGFFPTTIAGTFVTFNTIPAPLIYVSANAVAAIVPYELAGAGSADIIVNVSGKQSSTTTVEVVGAAPGVFTANATGVGQAATLNQNGTLNSAANPAKLGSTISLFVTGEGQTNPRGITGKPAGGLPLPAPLLPVSVSIGGQAAIVNFAGSAPTLVGLMQVNAQIPAQVVPGNAVPVVVSVGGSASQTGATIAVVQ